MNAAFGSRGLKAFNHALACLSRYSDSLDLLCMPDEAEDGCMLRMSAVNSSVSAFCAFFFTRDFFDVLELREGVAKAECRLQIKPIQSVLRSRSNKGVMSCEVNLIDDDDESRIAVRLHCARGVTKTHKLTYEAKQSIFPCAQACDVNIVVIPSKVMSEWLEHFMNTKHGGEVTMWVGPTFCIMRSKAEEIVEKSQLRRAIQTEVKVDLEAFDRFDVTQESILCFALKEFKAAIAVGEHLGVPLQLFFQEGGAPLHIKLGLDVISAEMVLATSEGERPLGVGATNPPGAAAAAAPTRTSATAAAQTTQQQQRPDGAGSARAASQQPPMESTPLPRRANGASDRPERPRMEPPPPLFRGRASQEGGDADAEMAEGRQGVDDGDGDLDDGNDEDWELLDQVEHEYASGQVRVSGSQVVRSSQADKPADGDRQDESGSQGERGREVGMEDEDEEPQRDERELVASQPGNSAVGEESIGLSAQRRRQEEAEMRPPPRLEERYGTEAYEREDELGATDDEEEEDQLPPTPEEESMKVRKTFKPLF